MGHILFVSSMESNPWGGSEELWFGASLRLAESGHRVTASIKGWGALRAEAKVAMMQNVGIRVIERYPPKQESLSRRVLQRLGLRHRRVRDCTASVIVNDVPDLVCVSNGNYRDGLWAMEMAHHSGVPFVSVVQANAEFLWPDDVLRERLERVYCSAEAVYCVSKSNLQLLRNMLAVELESGKVIRNPFNVPYEVSIPWVGKTEVLRLASVARIEPDAKGQDLLLMALQDPLLVGLPIEVSLYGRGRSAKGVEKLAQLLGVEDKVKFMGEVSDVTAIWRRNQALVLASRYEGLPLAIVEAMLCSRPIITTNVAGNAELLTQGETGFITASVSSSDLAVAIRQAWDSRERLEDMGRMARLAIERQVPRDPCREFAMELDKLLSGIASKLR